MADEEGENPQFVPPPRRATLAEIFEFNRANANLKMYIKDYAWAYDKPRPQKNERER